MAPRRAVHGRGEVVDHHLQVGRGQAVAQDPDVRRQDAAGVGERIEGDGQVVTPGPDRVRGTRPLDMRRVFEHLVDVGQEDGALVVRPGAELVTRVGLFVPRHVGMG